MNEQKTQNDLNNKNTYPFKPSRTVARPKPINPNGLNRKQRKDNETKNHNEKNHENSKEKQGTSTKHKKQQAEAKPACNKQQVT